MPIQTNSFAIMYTIFSLLFNHIEFYDLFDFRKKQGPKNLSEGNLDMMHIRMDI